MKKIRAICCIILACIVLAACASEENKVANTEQRSRKP